MAHYVYILYSITKDRFYVGSTSDVEERLNRHNAGATTSTKNGRPWKIVFTKQFDSKTEALKYENYIKRMKSRTFIESLIQKGSLAN
ncbi:MAG: GIY-YIG nuclease family protein [Bacteroidales bacterium]|nr:GIY-YIG nuclease family protein [Bacteroidales bacterium]